MNHARRVINADNPGSVELSTIKAEDFTFVIDEIKDGVPLYKIKHQLKYSKQKTIVVFC